MRQRPGIIGLRHFAALAVLLLGVAGCTVTTATTVSQSTATATVIKPLTHYTRVWAQPLSTRPTESPQLWVGVKGGAPRQLTHLTWNPPDPHINSGYWLGTPALAPDEKHVAFGLGYGEGDVRQTPSVTYVADMTTGDASPVPNSTGLVHNRPFAWINSNELVMIATGGLLRYNIATQSSQLLPNLPAGVASFYDDVEVRGSTLWFDITQDTDNIGQTVLYAYDLNSSAVLHHTTLGTVAEGLPAMLDETHWQGWDVSQDGLHVVYQLTGLANGVYDKRISSSAIWYAPSDLTNPTQILQYLSTDNVAQLALSPDGNWVAVTDALPTPNIVSGSVHSSGDKNDPTFHSYTPDAVDQPAWESDSASFYATTSGGIAQFALNGTPNGQGRIPGTIVTPDGRVPATPDR